MALIKLENLLDTLVLEDLRKKVGEGIEEVVELPEKDDYAFKLQLKAVKKGSKIFEGRLWFPQYILGELKHPSIGVYGCLCQFKPDSQGYAHQGISLQKFGRYLPEKRYRMIDAALEKLLARRILPKLLGVELEYVKKEGDSTTTYAVKNPGLWGKQSCENFKWHEDAILRMIELEEAKKEDLELNKYGPYRVCGNCHERSDCKGHLEIKKNRKRKPDPIVEVNITEEEVKTLEYISGEVDYSEACKKCGEFLTTGVIKEGIFYFPAMWCKNHGVYTTLGQGGSLEEAQQVIATYNEVPY